MAATRPTHFRQQFPRPWPRAARFTRTAIACGYCRKRKIRCFGFDSDVNGRCHACNRRNIQCIFTPASPGTGSFVPAHAVYPHMRNDENEGRSGEKPPVLHSAYGPPLLSQQPQAASQTIISPPVQKMYCCTSCDSSTPASLPPESTPDRSSAPALYYPDPRNLAPIMPVETVSYRSLVSGRCLPPPHDRGALSYANYPYETRHPSFVPNRPNPWIQPQTATPLPPISALDLAHRVGVKELVYGKSIETPCHAKINH